jgi:hypothetical protein
MLTLLEMVFARLQIALWRLIMSLRIKGQNWSFDAIIAVAIFMVVLMSFLYITSNTGNSKNLNAYADEAARIPDLFSRSQNQSLRFIEGNRVDTRKLNEITAMDYDTLRFTLGIQNDFCIHFEDDKGNVIFINESSNITGIGSPKAKISNRSCT